MEINNKHDKGYKDLFSNKETFITLLRSFLNKPWVNEIDVNELECVDKSFILHDYAEKEADIVYKAKIKDTNVIFYVLLELQSSVDKTMPIRLLFYMNEIWRDYIKNNVNSDKLPAIIPMVLYNGEKTWSVPKNFKEMIEGYEIFGGELLDFSYLLFDVKNYEEEELLSLANIVSTIFYLDKQSDIETISIKLKTIINVIKNLSEKDANFLKRWLRFIVRSKFPKGQQKEFDKMLDENINLEVEDMVSNFATSIEKAIEQSKMEGKIEGKIEEKRDMAKKLLENGAETEFVVKITGLSRKEVEELIL